LPIILAEGATLDQANAFKVALDAARAEVKIIDESQ
jgi:hypothetical protein